jgi:protocatechuate 3,4-dioxygenase beta subunit
MTSIERKLLSRRKALGLLGFAGAAFGVACGASPTAASSTASTTGSTTSTNVTGNASTTGATASTAACVTSPEETAGPYPDRLGMINNAAFFRQDITEGRSGQPLALVLTVVNTKAGCTPVANANVEIWQCDATGNYSEYAQPSFNGTGQTFLRGVQTTDGNGQVTFKTIYPGWYAGRATHIHVQVFMNGLTVKTTQIAFPEDVSAQVYRTGVYASHGQNSTTNARDNVFADGVQDELAAVSGNAAGGYTATLQVGISV